MAGVSEPLVPDAKALQPPGELEAAAVVAQEGHSVAATTALDLRRDVSRSADCNVLRLRRTTD